ncbi:MAG: hypothetical protein U0996_02070 [Planctomycetaceae bacterium]
MPIRRSYLKALFLMALGAAPVAAQDGNPFAEWDRQTARTTSKTARKTSKPTEYFSAKPAEEAEENTDSQESAAPVRQVRMRERSAAESTASTSKPTTAAAKPAASKAKATKPAAPVTEEATVSDSEQDFSWASDKPAAAPSKTAAATAKPAAKATVTESAASRTSPASARPAKAAAPAAEIRQAGFEARSEKEKKGTITQIRKDAAAAPEKDQNPFNTYLKHSAPEATDDASDFERAVLAEKKKPAAPSTAAPKTSPAAPRANVTMPVSSSRVLPGSAPKAAAATASVADAGPQSPGVSVQWVRHGEFNVGQECDVDLLVQNNSKSTIRSVMTEAVIPSEVEMLEATPAPMTGTEVPTWTFGELKPGESRTVKLRVIPRQRGDVRLDAFVRLTGSSSAAFSVQEPMIGVAVAGPDKVEVGQQAAYSIRVSNPGTGIANNVVIQAAIPEGLEHRSGSLLTIDIGTLNPGESRQAKLNLTAVKGGSQELAVRAVAEGGLTDESMTSVEVAEPQLQIAITGPEEQMSGRTADYKMTVSNAGIVQSANVRAKYRIPEGFEFVAANRGGKYAKADHSIEWFVGTLQPDETSEFQLTLKATKTGEALHQAGVISEHGQVTMCENLTQVEGTAALDLKIAASQPSVKAGEEIEWQVTIANTGSRAANAVGLSCELPAGFELVAAEGPSEYIAENGVMVFRSLPEVAAGETVTFTISGKCLRAGNQHLRLRVASESITEPLIGEETATVTN